MTTYSCEQGCGMSVKGFTCGSCGKELVHETLTKDDGSTCLLYTSPSPRD